MGDGVIHIHQSIIIRTSAGLTSITTDTQTVTCAFCYLQLILALKFMEALRLETSPLVGNRHFIFARIIHFIIQFLSLQPEKTSSKLRKSQSIVPVCQDRNLTQASLNT